MVPFLTGLASRWYGKDPVALQPHLRVREGQLPSIVLLPGDPARVHRIAKHLTDVEDVANNREFLTVRGTFEGRPVGVTSTGIGCPSAAIAVEELANVGVNTLIRVGTCGALRAGIGVGDLIIPFAAVRAEGTTREYLPPEFPAVADAGVYQSLRAAAEALKARYHVGIDRCHDAFYEPTGNLERWGALARDARLRVGISALVSSEMECSSVFLVGMLRGCKTGAVLAVNTVEPLSEIGTVPNAVYTLAEGTTIEEGIERAIRVALRAAKNAAT